MSWQAAAVEEGASAKIRYLSPNCYRTSAHRKREWGSCCLGKAFLWVCWISAKETMQSQATLRRQHPVKREFAKSVAEEQSRYYQKQRWMPCRFDHRLSMTEPETAISLSIGS
jgi:hypothetical protein